MAPFAQPFPLVGGVNIRNDPRAIADSQLTRTANVFPDINGILSKRPPLRYAFRAPSTGISRITAVKRAPPESGAAFILFGISYDNIGFRAAAIDSNGQLVAAYPPTLGTSILSAVSNPPIVNYEGDALVFVGAGFDGVLCFHQGAWKVTSYLIDVPLTEYQPQTAGTVSPEVAFTYRGQVVIANFGAGFTTSYSISDYDFPSTYAPPSPFFVPRYLFVGAEMLAFNAPHRVTLRDEINPIVAGIECMLQAVGSATQTAFLLFGANYAFLGTGTLGASTDTDPDTIRGDLEVKRVNYDCGCAAPLSLLRSQYGVLWVGPDDVWLMDVGGIPRRVGTNIRTALAGCPLSLRGQIWATFFDNCYRLAIPTQMSSDDGVDYEHWVLDMRDGAPQDANAARWFGPHHYANRDSIGTNLDDMIGIGVVDELSGRLLVPCGMNVIGTTAYGASLLFADIAGLDGMPWDLAQPIANDPLTFDPLADYNVGDVVRPFDQGSASAAYCENGHQYVCTVAGNAGGNQISWPNSGDVTEGTVTFTELFSLPSGSVVVPKSNLGAVGHGEIYPSGAAYNTEVLFDVRTKEYAHGDGAVNKTLARVEVDFECDSPGQLNLDIIENQGSGTDTASILASTQANERAGSLRLDAAVVSAEAHQRSIRPNEDNRVIFKRGIYRLYDDSLFVIDDSNDTIYIQSSQGAFVVTLIHDNYATMKALLDALVQAIYEVLLARDNEVQTHTHNRTGQFGQGVVVGLGFSCNGVGPDELCSIVFNDPTDTAANQVLQKRCANLFAMLGYDTSRDQGGGVQATVVFFDASDSDLRTTWASGSVPETNPQQWRLIEANAFGKVWGGRPFTNSDRKTGNE